MVDDQPSRKRLAESRGGSATGDVDEDTMVATLLETRQSMIAQLAAGAAREGETRSVFEEHDGLDSPEYEKCTGAGWSASRQRNGNRVRRKSFHLESPSSKNDGSTSTKVTKSARISAAAASQRQSVEDPGRWSLSSLQQCHRGVVRSFLWHWCAQTDFLNENGVLRKPSRTPMCHVHRCETSTLHESGTETHCS